MHAHIAYKAALITKSKKRILKFYYKNICFSSFLFNQKTRFQAFSCFAVTQRFQRRKRKWIAIAAFLYQGQSPVLLSQFPSFIAAGSPRTSKTSPCWQGAMAGRICGSLVIIYAFRISVSLIHSLLSIKSLGTALQFLVSWDLAFVCKFLRGFFFLPSAIGLSMWSRDRYLNHAGFPAPKLGLYLTYANATFFIHLSISEPGCLSYKAEQASFGISWSWMLSPI